MAETRFISRLLAGPRIIFGVTLSLCAAACFGLPHPAAAQVFGQFSPATVLERGDRTLGAYGLFGDESWGALGVGRMGIGRGLEVGVAGGFASHDDTPLFEGPNTLLLGADGRYQIRWASPEAPVDASLGFALGVETGDGFTRWAFAPQALTSHRIVYDDTGRAVTPYGSLAFEYERVEVPGLEDSDLDLRARIGGAWEPSSRLALSAELGFGGGVTFAAGARWPF